MQQSTTSILISGRLIDSAGLLAVRTPGPQQYFSIFPKLRRRWTVERWPHGTSKTSREWPEDRLTEAVEWLTSRPQGNIGPDAARRVVAKHLIKSDPVGAIDVAMDMPNRCGSEREQLIINAAWNLYRNDPETVIDWLPDSGLSEETQRAILSPES